MAACVCAIPRASVRALPRCLTVFATLSNKMVHWGEIRPDCIERKGCKQKTAKFLYTLTKVTESPWQHKIAAVANDLSADMLHGEKGLSGSN